MTAQVQIPTHPTDSPASFFASLRALGKSGIVTLVLISVGAGYLIGHPLERPFDWKHALATLLGILGLATGSAALNQIQERHLDSRMQRTAKRPLPSGALSLQHAWAFVLVMCGMGVVILFSLSRELGALGLLALFSYNVLYTEWWKPRHAYAAVPGAIPGALPVAMGAIAASGDWKSPTAWYLFFILFFWQMPHFWVLALKYRDDYALGGFPTLPVARGASITRDQILVWSIAYVGIGLAAPLFLPLGWLYMTVAGATGAWVVYEALRFYRNPDEKCWLRFFLSVNFSLILYLATMTLDLWSIYLLIPILAT